MENSNTSDTAIENNSLVGKHQSQEISSAAVDPATLPDVVFVVQGEKYSISSRYVLHIGVMPKINYMTGLEPYCRGIILFNDHSVPVYDLRKLFGMSSFEEEWDQMIHQRMADHRRWVDELEKSVENETEFALTTDPHQCAFGKWYDNFSTDNSYLNLYLKQIEAPHAAIHRTGEAVKKLMREGKKDEALAVVADMKKKYFTKTMEILENMSRVYKDNRREMLIIMQVEGSYLSIVADSISSIKKLTEIYDLPEDGRTVKEDYIEMLAKENKNSDVIQMLNPFALIS